MPRGVKRGLIGFIVVISGLLIGVSYRNSLYVSVGSLAKSQVTCAPSINTGPNFTASGNVFGRIASQWNQYFQSKLDANNGTACNLTLLGTVNIGLAAVTSALGFTPLNPANNLSELISKVQGLSNIEPQTIVTGTGVQTICANTVVTIWTPTVPAPAILQLPESPIVGQRCTIDNNSTSSLYAATLTPTGGKTLLSENGVGNVVLGPPGSSLTVRFVAASSQWTIE